MRPWQPRSLTPGLLSQARSLSPGLLPLVGLAPGLLSQTRSLSLGLLPLGVLTQTVSHSWCLSLGLLPSVSYPWSQPLSLTLGPSAPVSYPWSLTLVHSAMVVVPPPSGLPLLEPESPPKSCSCTNKPSSFRWLSCSPLPPSARH